MTAAVSEQGVLHPPRVAHELETVDAGAEEHQGKEGPHGLNCPGSTTAVPWNTADSEGAHVTTFIEESVRIGTVVCETDPVVAAQRLETMRSATELPPPFAPPIVAGVLQGSPLAGYLGVQPRLRTTPGASELADDVLGPGFTLLSLVELDGPARAAVRDLETRIGLRSAVVGPAGTAEEGAALGRWLGDAGAVAVVVRPDFYVFGSVSKLDEVPALLASLSESLSLAPTTDSVSSAVQRSLASRAGAR